MMKSMLLFLTLAIGAFVIPTAHADTAVTVTPGSSMTFQGTVTEVNPSSHTMILTSPSASSPVTYTYTPDTVFLDASGQPVSYEVIRNSPVKLDYVKEGGKTIVRRVTVIKEDD